MRTFRKKGPKELVPAGKLFEALLGKLGYDADAYAAFEVWDRLLGREAAKARASALQGRRLLVEVDSSARLHDLMLRKRGLLQKLNGHFGTRRVVSDIIFKLASEPRHSAAGSRHKGR